MFTVISTQVNAKTENRIFGKVVEKSSGEVLAYATVTVHSPEKSVLAGTYTSQEGKFEIQNVEEGEKVLKVSFIGYKDTTINTFIEYVGNSFNLGTIELDPAATQLAAAIVTSKVPVIEQKLDKLVMNVSEAVHTQGSNALEVLRKAPGLSIDPSGNILLNGQAVQIWIDNRPSNLSGQDLTTLLNATDGSTIDKIEIMAHPSSKYDASGSGGIINIKTKKNFMKGLNGSVRLGYDGGTFDKLYSGYNGTVNASYRTDKNNTFVMLAPRYNEAFYQLSSETYYNNTLMKSLTKERIFQDSYNFRLGNDFYINKKNILGFITYGVLRKMNGKSFGDTGSQLYDNGSLVRKTDTYLSDKKDFGNISGNLNYSYLIKDGNELTLNLDYGYYDINNYASQDNENYTSSNVLLDPVRFTSNSLQFINLVSFKADYEKIVMKSAKMETGFKVAQSYTNNDLTRQDFIAGNWEFNNQLSSKFNYREIITAGYISLAKQLNSKFVGKAGLRAEYTDSRGNWISSNTSTSKGYLDLFPTAFLSYNPNRNFRYSLSYTLRISRPNYNQLNPFRQYVDAQSSVEGNPDLDPEKTHELAITAGYKSHLNLSFVFQQTNGKIIQNPFFDEETGQKKLVYENFGTQTLTGLAFSITELPLAKWLTFNANTFTGQIKNVGVEGYTSNSIFTQGNATFTFVLPKSYKVEINSSIQSGLPYGYFRVLPQGDVSLSLKKTMLNNKADLAINFNDIFDTQHERIRMKDYAINEYKLDQRSRTRYIGINFSYRFGQGKAAKQRKVGVQDEAGRVSTQ